MFLVFNVNIHHYESVLLSLHFINFSILYFHFNLFSVISVISNFPVIFCLFKNKLFFSTHMNFLVLFLLLISFSLFKNLFFEVYLIYNVVLISTVQQSGSYIYEYIYIYILFHILFHYGLSQDIEYSSLCYTVEHFCLSNLYIIVCCC